MFLAVGLVVGYAGFQSDRGRGASGTSTSSEVLATVGDSEITRADVEALRPSDFQNLNQQVYDLTDRTLDVAIQRELLNLEAESRGMELNDLVAAEIDDKIQEPTGEEISAFYEARRPSGTLEDLTPQIRSLLRDEARKARIWYYLGQLED